ncbi:MAG: glutamine--tRNA ligase/YqeY domain fusion protein [Clostridia bacterium]|nr:glutamine--tRNA ligase/YqeY domain fusion protein [Clostridia bacterium]
MAEMQATNFIEQIVNEDLTNQKVTAVQTRFPPEPNGYLHIGHVKSMLVNFGTALKYNGKCNLFFDDTNPSKEKTEFVNAIRKDIEWVGYSWTKEVYASDFFEKIYEYAEQLIQMGKAFVCDLTAEEISALRGTLKEPGKESPYRNRSVEENLQLFREMRAGKYPDGAKCLRAKIDMASPNINLRDPVIYRILRSTHHRTGDAWCIYPMYDYAHPICDYLQGVTHSLCTLEFEDHRPLYDWVGITLGFNPKPRQIEFARLNITNTVMSKRYLKKLVEQNLVHGWDDPRMPTVAGLRNRGIPPKALLDFCEAAGICKADSICEQSYLEHFIRDNLNANAERAMVVVDPLKLTITNYEGEEEVEFTVNPTQENSPVRTVPFGKHIYIEKGDFALVPPPKYNRLKLGGYVRLKGAYIVQCDDIIKDENGEVVEVLCHYIPESRSNNDTSGIKVKGTIHWVSADRAVDCTVKNYSYLLNDAAYDGQDFDERMNLNSETVIEGAKAEPYLLTAEDGKQFQLLRTAYYKKCTDSGKLCLSFIVSMKDSYKK